MTYWIVSSSVVDIVLAKISSVTFNVCSVILKNKTITASDAKFWCIVAMTINCVLFAFGAQRKSVQQEVVSIL
jgi:hypothetical protein